MARKETTTAPAAPKELDGELMAKDVAAIDQRNADLAVIDAKYGESLPYDATRIENEARFYLTQSASAMLEAGKRFLLLKEHEQHGAFTKSLSRIGVEARTARNMMKATLKFSDKTETVSVLSAGKLYTLMTQDDEDLAALEEGGTIAGLNLDKIDQLTNVELKKALRAAQQEKEATDKIIENKDKKINELDRDAQRIAALEGQPLHEELKKDLAKSLGHCLGEFRVLSKSIEAIQFRGDAPDHLKADCYQALQSLRIQLNSIELDNQVQPLEADADLDADGIPEWMIEE